MAGVAAEVQGKMTSQPCLGLTSTTVDNPGGPRVAPMPSHRCSVAGQPGRPERRGSGCRDGTELPGAGQERRRRGTGEGRSKKGKVRTLKVKLF